VAIVPQTKQPYKPPSAYVSNVPKPPPKPKPVVQRQYYANPTVANDMSAYGYDKPGTVANPSAPTVLMPDGSYQAQVPKTVTVPGTPGKWITQDYSQWIPTDWEVTGAEGAGREKQAAAEAQFQQNLRRAFIDFGGDASKLDDKYRSYIDDPTIEAAKANKFSQTAQNLAAMTKTLANRRAQLAARGMSFSGANTQATRAALDAREQADYSAGRGFTGAAEQGLTDLTTVGQQIRDAIANARASAAARLAAQYPAQWDPGTEDQTQTVYEDPVYTPPPARAPAPRAPAPPPRQSYINPGKPETAYERALRIRSEAMNKRYGLG
jgi:hypothetical protein